MEDCLKMRWVLMLRLANCVGRRGVNTLLKSTESLVLLPYTSPDLSSASDKNNGLKQSEQL